MPGHIHIPNYHRGVRLPADTGTKKVEDLRVVSSDILNSKPASDFDKQRTTGGSGLSGVLLKRIQKLDVDEGKLARKKKKPITFKID